MRPIALALILFVAGMSYADTLYEHYDGPSNNDTSVYGTGQKAMTFTPATTHVISTLKVNVKRRGSPKDFTWAIHATAEGKPTGAALCSATVAAATLAGWSTSEAEQTITISSGATLTLGTTYAVVMHDDGTGDASNCLTWFFNTTGGYAGGSMKTSTNAGSSWSNTSDAWDLLFKEYGADSGTSSPIAPIISTINRRRQQ